jgi:DNA recombination protein RmuC
VGDVEEIGRRLGAAQQSYDDAHGKLTSGKGNLIRQVERIRELGLKPAKVLPARLTEDASESESAAEAKIRALPSSKAS